MSRRVFGLALLAGLGLAAPALGAAGNAMANAFGIGCGAIVFMLVFSLMVHATFVWLAARTIGLTGGFPAAFIASLIGLVLTVVAMVGIGIVGIPVEGAAQSITTAVILVGVEAVAIRKAFQTDGLRATLAAVLAGFFSLAILTAGLIAVA